MSAPQRIERHLRREVRPGTQRALVIASLLRCPERNSKVSPHDRRG